MSNMPPLRTVHGNGAFMSRPKSQWRGGRYPRTARGRWELQQAIQQAMKARQVIAVPELPDPNAFENCQKPECQAARSSGFVLTNWQHDLMHRMNKEENNA